MPELNSPAAPASPAAFGECDVLVIGGGPAGSTIGALLAQRGRNCRLELLVQLGNLCRWQTARFDELNRMSLVLGLNACLKQGPNVLPLFRPFPLLLGASLRNVKFPQSEIERRDGCAREFQLNFLSDSQVP